MKKKTKKLRKLGAILLLASLFISIFTLFPVSQHAKAYTPEEQLNAAKAKYPVLLNGGFETGDFSSWDLAYGDISMVTSPDAPDGTHYAKAITSGWGWLFKDKILMGTELSFYYAYGYGGVTYPGGIEHTFYFYDCYGNQLGTYVSSFSVPVGTSWTFYNTTLRDKASPSAKYFGLLIGLQRACIDKIAIGGFTEPTRIFSINPCDTQTVQSQYEFVSFWMNNQLGTTINNVKLTVENFALKSLTVNCISISGNDIGYHNPSEQKFIQLGIESPATLGDYNISVVLTAYDIYNQEISRDKFLLCVHNEIIKITTRFNQEIYELGQFQQLNILNEMDRQVNITVYAWYGSEMFLYGDSLYVLEIGQYKNFTLALLKYGKYTFEFRINFYEILQLRTLIIRKQIEVIPTNDIYSKFATELWEVKGNTTLEYSFYTNNTEISSYDFYVRITYPNGQTTISIKTASPGLYEWYFPISLPANYSKATFKVEVFRKINTTADIQYGTGEYYQDGLKVWERTYTVYEGSKPISIVGWLELESCWWIILLTLVILLILVCLILIGKRGKRNEKT